MFLLYVDESGSPGDPNQQHFVLAGLSVFERETHWIEEQLNAIAARFNPADPYSVELHGSPMRSGRGEWKGLPLNKRLQAIRDALQIVADRHPRVRLFASVIHRDAPLADDPVNAAFEQLASRFDYFLRREHLRGNTQRGIAVFDKSTTEKSIQNLARTFKHDGHSWGQLLNFSEVPLFLDSRASRLIQLADLVAFAIFRRFEAGDSQFYDIIAHCFDHHQGRNHGLYVKGPQE
ncbi:DUF3800 domain-containing protein [Microbulbifer thermotolerans]|uniref:DUF3800 domain-containing protein n=1 Tax=Microbulbifer thermotolerans TaxID=252514 RepID=UPI002249109F|nr:DUF3800 domain-containing protein [Microbulbifer thermotolerans]MCX2830435.1 DUF3800 domain-containing protein [Microbulbifer thermotolerans]